MASSIETRGFVSPFLFLFVMEVLSKMIEGLVEGGSLNGFSMGNRGYDGSIDISHLLFVDDTLIFCDANIGHSQSLRALLFFLKLFRG